MAKDTIFLDPKKFKHVKSDKHTTTLRHADGHELTIAHSAVTPSMQKALSALGGSAKAAQTPLQADEAHDQKYADGGEVDDYGYPKKPSASPTPHPRVDQIQATAPKPKDHSLFNGYAEGGEVKSTSHKMEHQGHKFEIRPAHNGAGHQLQHTSPKGEINTHHGFKDANEAHAMAKSIAGKEEYAQGGKVSPKAQPQEPKQKPVVKKREDPRFGNTTVIDNEDKRHGAVIKKFAHGGMTQDPDAKDDIENALGALDDGQPRQVQDFTQNPYNAVDAITTRLPASPNIDANAKPQYQLASNDMTNDGLSPKSDDAVAMQANAPGAAPEQLASAESPQGAISSPADTPSEEVAQPQAQGIAQPQAKGVPSSGALLDQSYNNAISGIDQQAKAEGDLGKEQAKIQADAAKASDDARTAFQDSYKETLNELHQHMQDVKEGQIDPDKYWTGDKDGNGSHSRIMTGIGMILAGFNPTSNPNAAIDYVKHQMDKNIEAQTKNLDSKQNLVRANLEQFHNLQEATNMARLQQADVVNHYLDQAAANAKTPMSKAAALMAKSKFAQDFIPLVRTQAMYGMMGRLQDQGPDAQGSAIAQMKMVDPERAKLFSEAFVPAVGLSKSLTTVPANVREQIVSQQKLANSATDVLNYVKTHTNIVPGTASYNEGVTKASILQQQIREGMLGTVFRESEKPLLNQFVNQNPAGFLKALNSEPKLRTILEANESQLNTLKSNYDLPTTHSAKAPSSAGPVKGKDGKMYQLDPSGKYYIPVGK